MCKKVDGKEIIVICLAVTRDVSMLWNSLLYLRHYLVILVQRDIKSVNGHSAIVLVDF